MTILSTVIWAQFRTSRGTSINCTSSQKCDLSCCCDLFWQSATPQSATKTQYDDVDNHDQIMPKSQRHLIIDGSNGPMHLHKQHLDLNEGMERDDNDDERSDGNRTMSRKRRKRTTETRPLHLAISLLNVKDGINQGDRIHVIPLLDSLLHGVTRQQNHIQRFANCSIISTLLSFLGNIKKRNFDCNKGKLNDQLLKGTRTTFDNVTIYYDGLGKRDLADRTWRLSPNIDLKVTNIEDEADDVIVEQVKAILNENMGDTSFHAISDSNTQANRKQSQSIVSLLNLQDIIQSEDSESFIDQYRRNHNNSDLNDFPISDRRDCTNSTIISSYTITRNLEGPGKSRKRLKNLRLLREKSVLCLFPSGFGNSLQANAICTTKNLLPAEKLIDCIEKRLLDVDLVLDEDMCICTNRHEGMSVKSAVVVTDDILLRQRVVELGGHAMLFEQFWDLLSDVKKVCTS